MEGVKRVFGFLLIGMALYFLGPILPKAVDNYLLPVFMVVAALYLLFIDKLANDIKGFRLFKTIFSVIIIALGVYFLVPTEKKSPEWVTYTDTAYEEAISSNQKVLLDFYADWCIPCKELDALTFSDDRVLSELKEFTTYKIDMTKTMSDETERIRNKFKIVGMPTIIFIDSKGKEVKRISEFINADDMLNILSGVN